jgi:hypothetical protein
MDTHDVMIGVEAATAMLHSMAGGLTALVVPEGDSRHLAAMQQDGPALAISLSSLNIQVELDEAERDISAAAQTVQALGAGLQHVELGLSAPLAYEWTRDQVEAADAHLAQLMLSLPCCHQLSLSLGGHVSSQAEGRALLRHAPHLLLFSVHSDHVFEQVTHLHSVLLPIHSETCVASSNTYEVKERNNTDCCDCCWTLHMCERLLCFYSP